MRYAFDKWNEQLKTTSFKMLKNSIQNTETVNILYIKKKRNKEKEKRKQKKGRKYRKQNKNEKIQSKCWNLNQILMPYQLKFFYNQRT